MTKQVSPAVRRCVLLLGLTALLTAPAGCGGRAARLNNAGNEAFAAGDYSGAQVAYEAALGARGDLVEAQYNLGNTLERRQLGAEAGPLLQDAAQRAAAQPDASAEAAAAATPAAGAEAGPTPVLSARAWFNLGNVHFGAQEWSAAAEAYRQALRLAPGDLDAKINLELTLRRMQQNEQPTATPSPTPAGGETTPTATATPSPTPTPQGGDGTSTPETPSPEAPTPEPPTATPSPTPSPTPQPGATPGAGSPTPAQPPPGATLPALLGGQPLTPEQALRLLQAAAAETTSVQQELQQGLPVPPSGIEKDW